jgi:NADP-dependent 3-hydroxy acid dehydrogenase YdfG
MAVTSRKAKVWFVTGSSAGLGRAIATAALERGDRVAASARQPDTLAELVDRYGDAALVLPLDVTQREAAAPALETARSRFGRIDVVVNNAGHGLLVGVEDTTEQEARELMETNFFGLLWVTQAALAVFREQGEGHLIQMSSGAGLRAAPLNGVYAASKWAVEGLSDAVAAETRTLGVKVTIAEPGVVATGFFDRAVVEREGIAANEEMRRAFWARVRSMPLIDPRRVAGTLLEVVDADDPPLRILLGIDPDVMRDIYTQRLSTWAAWDHRSRPPGSGPPG